MMKDKWQRRITIFAVAFHLISLVGLLTLETLASSNAFATDTNVSAVDAFLLLLCCGWLPMSSLALCWLAWIGRNTFQSTVVWIASQLVFSLLLLGGQGQIAVVRFVASAYFLPFMALLFWIDILYAIQRHFALVLSAVGSLSVIWAVVLGWRFQGNPIIIFLDSLNQASNPLLWLNVVMLLGETMVLAGLITWFIEFFRVSFREMGAVQKFGKRR